MRWRPGPSYYLWLRWLTGQSYRVWPGDPKPWKRLDRFTIGGPDGRPIKTWREPPAPVGGSDASTDDRRRLSLRTRLGFWLLHPYALDRVVAARNELNAESDRESRHGGYAQGVFSTWYWIGHGKGRPS
jgi:hypothetical protein